MRSAVDAGMSGLHTASMSLNLIMQLRCQIRDNPPKRMKEGIAYAGSNDSL